jgi:hypothetical protein
MKLEKQITKFVITFVLCAVLLALGAIASPLAAAVTAAQPVMPRMATPKEYLTNEDDLAKLYNNAASSFIPTAAGSVPRPEQLVPIDKDGNFGDMTLGSTQPGDNGGMHARASIPTDSSAIIHTHPYGLTQTPSQDDYDTAKRIGKPNFVVTRDSIFVAMPNGDIKHPVKVASISSGKHGKLNIKWN